MDKDSDVEVARGRTRGERGRRRVEEWEQAPIQRRVAAANATPHAHLADSESLKLSRHDRRESCAVFFSPLCRGGAGWLFVGMRARYELRDGDEESDEHETGPEDGEGGCLVM